MVRGRDQSNGRKAFAKQHLRQRLPPEALTLAYPNITLVPPRPFRIQSMHAQPCSLSFSLKISDASLLTIVKQHDMDRLAARYGLGKLKR